jgi:hypothetical protein
MTQAKGLGHFSTQMGDSKCPDERQPETKINFEKCVPYTHVRFTLL